MAAISGPAPGIAITRFRFADRPSVVVLPCRTLSDDPAQGSSCGGMVGDTAGLRGRLSGLASVAPGLSWRRTVA